MTKRYWQGKITCCDLCEKSIKETFVDGMTKTGPWAIMCQSCFDDMGRGIGTGLGQVYQEQPDGRWMNTAG